MKCIYINNIETISQYGKKMKIDEVNDYIGDCQEVKFSAKFKERVKDFKFSEKYKILYDNNMEHIHRNVAVNFKALIKYPEHVKMGWNICYNDDLIIYAERLMFKEPSKEYVKVLTSVPYYRRMSPKAIMINKYFTIYGPSIVCRKDCTDLTMKDFVGYYNESKLQDDPNINTFLSIYDKGKKPTNAAMRYEKAQKLLNELVSRYAMTYDRAWTIFAKTISGRYVVNNYEYCDTWISHSYREFKKMKMDLINGTRDSGESCVFDTEKHSYPCIHPTKTYREVFNQ